CDFRRPALHQVFDLPRGPGLAEVLRGEVALDAALRPGPVEGLAVLPAGEGSDGIGQGLLLENLRRLLDEARGSYDFVLVDCCPVLPVADALLVGRRADGVLLSVRPGVSQVPHVAEARERLASLRIPVLGAVVNGVRPRLRAYDYAYQRASAD